MDLPSKGNCPAADKRDDGPVRLSRYCEIAIWLHSLLGLAIDLGQIDMEQILLIEPKCEWFFFCTST